MLIFYVLFISGVIKIKINQRRPKSLLTEHGNT